MRRYHKVESISRADAMDAFSSGDTDRIVHAIIRLAFHDADVKWVQTLASN